MPPRRKNKGELRKAFRGGNINRILQIARDIPESAKENIRKIVAECNRGPKCTPLKTAMLNGNYHICKLLIEDGEPINTDYGIGNPSLLCLTLKEKQTDIALLLIESGANVNLSTFVHGITYPLYYALYYDHPPSVVEAILKAGFDANAPVQTNNDVRGIQVASNRNNLEAVKLLVKYKADVNAVNLMCENALLIAVENNYIDIVKYLISEGAEFESVIIHCSPHLLAIKKGNLKMLKLLIESGCDPNSGTLETELMPPLHYACRFLNIPIITYLVEKGADVNGVFALEKETALHRIALNHGTQFCSDLMKLAEVKLTSFLIDKGAKISYNDVFNRSPLDCALATKKLELMKLLIREGACVTQTGDVPAGQPLGWNRFIGVVYELGRFPDLIELYLQHGADYNQYDNNGLTPYHYAMHTHNADVIKLFWRYRCPFDQQEGKKGSLRICLRYKPTLEDRTNISIQDEFINGIKINNIKTVRSALQKGAEPRGTSLVIESTLHYAAANGNQSMIKLLLKRGVAVNTVDRCRRTPLDVAFEMNHLEACKVLLRFGAVFNYEKITKSKNFRATEQNKDMRKMFVRIFRSFRMAKKGDLNLWAIISYFCQIEEDFITIKILLNCVNREGLSLIGVALKYGHLVLARELMLLRTKYTH